MSDNIKQESTESLQTKEQEQQAGSNKRTLEAENDKAAKKAFKEKKKKEKPVSRRQPDSPPRLASATASFSPKWLLITASPTASAPFIPTRRSISSPSFL